MERAEKHLTELQADITSYVNSHPYTFQHRKEAKKRPPAYRLGFTRQPDPMIGLIAADCIYNIRSGLGHLMAALVPPAHRHSVMFPIFFQGVWEGPVERENGQRAKERQRWKLIEQHAEAAAVDFLKKIQPPEDAGSDPRGTYALVALNQVSNADRHRRLPVISNALQAVTVTWKEADGRVRERTGASGANEGLEDNAKIPVPASAKLMAIRGTALVTIRVSDGGELVIPDVLTRMLQTARITIGQLSPYVRRP
jgi:hypothetical protein